MKCSLLCNAEAVGFYRQDSILHLLCASHLASIITIGLKEKGEEFLLDVKYFKSLSPET